MIDADFSFEYSSVKATINGNIISVKNPKSGFIYADSIIKFLPSHLVEIAYFKK